MRIKTELANKEFDSSKIAEFKNVWVFCEQREGKMMPTSFELISEGRKLANELGVKLFRTQGRNIALTEYGANKIVRQAVAMAVNREDIVSACYENGECGSIAYNFISPVGVGYADVNYYPYDPDAAVQTLIDDGWVYAEDGSDYVEGIRWKKFTAEEAGTYQYNVTLADGTILMPLKMDWSSSDGNSVSDLLSVMLANGEQTKAAGVEINQQVMTFTELLNYYYRDATQGDKYGVPTYCLFNLANNFTPQFDQSYEWTQDPDMIAQGYNVSRLYDDEIDKLSMDMVYGVDSSDTEKYMEIWKAYELRWNQMLPQVPLYSNVYITMYPDWLENYTQDSFWDFQQAILYATVKE